MALVRWHSGAPLRPEPCPPPSVTTEVDLSADSPVWALAQAHPNDVLAPVLRSGAEQMERLLIRTPPQLDALECETVLRNYAELYGESAAGVPQALARMATVTDVREALRDYQWPRLPVPAAHRVLLDCSGSDRFLWDKMDVDGIDTVRWHAVGGPLDPTKHWGADCSRQPVRHACCQRLYGAPGCWSASVQHERPRRFVMWWDSPADFWAMLKNGSIPTDVDDLAKHLESKSTEGTAFLETGERDRLEWFRLRQSGVRTVADYIINHVLPSLKRRVRPDVSDAPGQDQLRRLWELQLKLNQPHFPSQAPRLVAWLEFLANDILGVSTGLEVHGGEIDDSVIERNGVDVRLLRKGRATPMQMREFGEKYGTSQEKAFFNSLADALEALEAAKLFSDDHFYQQRLSAFKRRLEDLHEKANQVIRGVSPDKDDVLRIAREVRSVRKLVEEERSALETRLQAKRAQKELDRSNQQRSNKPAVSGPKDVLFPMRQGQAAEKWNVGPLQETDFNQKAFPLATIEAKEIAATMSNSVGAIPDLSGRAPIITSYWNSNVENDFRQIWGIQSDSTLAPPKATLELWREDGVAFICDVYALDQYLQLLRQKILDPAGMVRAMCMRK